MRPCQFYRWIDPPTPEHLVPVLIELRDQVRAMRMANRQENGHMDLALVDPEASRQQERAMVEIGFAATDVVAPTVQIARTHDVQLKCKMVEKELGLLKFVLVACVIRVLAVLFRK